MKRGKKLARILEDRQEAHDRMLRNDWRGFTKQPDTKARNRMLAGGYTRPGSRPGILPVERKV